METAQFQSEILRWYYKYRRTLPWRTDPSPYRVWISEIMLQQTQVATVLTYYERFLRRFPDLHSLARASEDEVLELWAGLGYYQRARNLLKAAILISKKQRDFPSSFKELLLLPGVGKYTAGAICSIAFNQPEPVVDGNIRRVITRLAGIRRRVPEKFFWDQMRNWIPRDRSSEFNQSMMELGALICTPAIPTCLRCPVRRFCVAYSKGFEKSLPKAITRKEVRKIRIVALVLQQEDKFLLTVTGKSQYIPGKWGFPCDEVPDRASPVDTAKNLCRKVLGRVVSLQECPSFRHSISHRVLFVHPYIGRVTGRRMKSGAKNRWEKGQNAPLVSSLFRKVMRRLP